MIGEITWCGEELSSLGNVFIESPPETNRPARKVERFEVPGRNGDIIIPQEAWENVTRSYDLICYGDYNQAAADLMEWLYRPIGYDRLEDSFDADVFRLAHVPEDTRIRNLANTDGRCTVEFDCDPRRFLKSGEEPILITRSGQEIPYVNLFPAKPLIQIISGRGSATITMSGKTLSISELVDGMVIDCEEMQAYLNGGAQNLNELVSGEFPVVRGLTAVILTGGIERLTVTPRWWAI